MHKIKSVTITSGMVKNDLKGTIESFFASDNACLFESSFIGTTAYWKEFLYGVPAMFEQFGITTYFPTLPCADLRWEELLFIINKLNNLGCSDNELKNLSYQERHNM